MAETSPGEEWSPDPAGIYFSDRFSVSPDVLQGYGAFDISVVADMPLFIDPFLLFNSDKSEYQALHDQIIGYLRFLREKADKPLSPGLIKNWYSFHEVKQNWLGFTVDGNTGHGLGRSFAKALHAALGEVLSNFGYETVTESSHLEKLSLIQEGVGRDKISDFATNLIKHFLLRYTEEFAETRLAPQQCKTVYVSRAAFNYNTETWATRRYTLPWTDGDYVLLTPLDMLTKDDTWINRNDMIGSFDILPEAVSDEQLRAQISNHFKSHLARNPSAKEIRQARARTLLEFPELIDYYIKTKEDSREQAEVISSRKVAETQALLRDQVQAAARDLANRTDFFNKPWTSYDEAVAAIKTFKYYVENQDGWRVINRGGGKPFSDEKEVQGFFGLLLQWSRFDVNREPNNGRGPVDFKLSEGAFDKTLIEFKLGSNSSLERNLQRQVGIYEKANKTKNSITAVICYTQHDQKRVERIVERLRLDKQWADKLVVVIDARADNKPSASKA